jgi:hypothetical protein
LLQFCNRHQSKAKKYRKSDIGPPQSSVLLKKTLLIIAKPSYRQLPDCHRAIRTTGGAETCCHEKRLKLVFARTIPFSFQRKSSNA